MAKIHGKHGKDTWQRYMAKTHGKDTWQRYMAIHGKAKCDGVTGVTAESWGREVGVIALLLYNIYIIYNKKSGSVVEGAERAVTGVTPVTPRCHPFQ